MSLVYWQLLLVVAIGMLFIEQICVLWCKVCDDLGVMVAYISAIVVPRL